MCLLTIIVIIAVKNKGIIYSLDYLAATVGFVFIIVDKYPDKSWLKELMDILLLYQEYFFG